MSHKLFDTHTSFDAKEKIWRGPKSELIVGSEVSLGRLVLEVLLKAPDHISQICDNNGRQYTNQDIAIMSIRVAQHLQEMDMQQEDVIGICAANTDFIAPVVFGALLCGTIISSLDQTFDKKGIQHIFSISKPKLVFCDGNVYNSVQESLTEIGLEIPIYTMKDHLVGGKQVQEFIAPTNREKSFTAMPLKLGSQQTAVVLCSSGTTGPPKAVCMSHESLLNSKTLNLSYSDKLLCFSTIYWISGFMCLLHGTLLGCTRIITDQLFSPELLLKIVEERKVNIVYMVPPYIAMITHSPDFKKRNLTSIQKCLTAGCAAPITVFQAFLEHVPCALYSRYGMSEICGACSYGIPTKSADNGQLVSNIEVKIIDDGGYKLGISQSGEVCIRTPFKWFGYFNNPIATKAIYDDDGWIHSGDIGYFDEDGSLFIVDRKKDIFKYNGYHIFPTEIEEVISEIPSVVEVCICGIPDLLSVTLPAAAIVKVPNSKLTEDEVRNYVAERMPHFNHLHGGVYFFESLPKTSSGKKIRTEVLKLVETQWHQRKEYKGRSYGRADLQVST